MTLYEINEQFAAAIELYENGVDEVVDTETGEVKSLADVLAELNMSREQKIENTVRYIKNLRADSESARAEASNLVERADRFDKKAEQLESYLLSQLGDYKKLETPLYTVKVRTSKSTCCPTDEEAIQRLPEGFWNIKTTVKVTPDKKAIKAALEKGEKLEGCSILENKRLSIS